MNHYGPRELHDAAGNPTGLWHYTCRNDGRTWPVGHCGPYRPCAACGGRVTNVSGLFVGDDPEDAGGPHCPACRGRGCVELPAAQRCPGHPTPQAACEHYREYLLDRLSFRGPRAEPWPKHKCQVDACDREATHLAVIPGGGVWQYELCEGHATREAVAALLVVGESVSSY